MKKNSLFLIIICLLCANLFSQKQNVQKIWLTKQKKTVFESPEWEFRQAGEGKWRSAEVPGNVHTDLLRNGDIPDPFFGNNEEKLQWIGEKNWEYHTSFSLTEKELARENIEIILEGLDTYAQVYVNDSLILSANNMFRTWEISCKKYLRKNNNLNIKFLSPLDSVKNLAKKLPYTLPENEKNQRSFIRKAAYHYGWDWGPTFITAGVWRPIYLRLWDNVKINDVQVVQNQVDSAKAELSFNWEIEASKEGEKYYLLASDDGEIEIVDSIFTKKGTNFYTQNLTIQNPYLWWTNGLGAPNLYHFMFRLITYNQLIDLKKVDIGLRKVEIVQQKDEKGKSFSVKLNGKSVFMKGANVIPFDSFLPRTSKEKYDSILFSAKNANMNMLRVWGGGAYEDDVFYELCDKYGILVWQDFMFACAMYPSDEDFLENVENEAIQNVKRLRNHPCIALWCGNNEIDEGWHNWGWQAKYLFLPKDSQAIWAGYQKLFHQTLANVVAKYDVARYYHPSSPVNGWGKKASLTEGDAHYWGVWWGLKEFNAYKTHIPRFMSEYGFQALPEMRTISTFVPISEQKIGSTSLKSHQKHPTGYFTIDTYLKREYKMPKNLSDYVYVTQILQAEGIRTAIEAHRRSKPYCMGTLYWQLNDCWQVSSWSSLDYFGRWKVLHHYAQDLYKNTIISIDGGKDSLAIYLVSDSISSISGKLILELQDFSGKKLWDKEMSITVAANEAKKIEISEFKTVKFNPTKVVLVAKWLANEKELAKTTYYFVVPKKLALPNPTFKIEEKNKSFSLLSEESNSGGYQIEIQSDKLAKNVYIYSESEDLKVERNGFDLLPNEKRTFFISNPKVKWEIKTLSTLE